MCKHINKSDVKKEGFFFFKICLDCGKVIAMQTLNFFSKSLKKAKEVEEGKPFFGNIPEN